MLDDYPPDTPPWAEDEEVTQLVHEIELASDLYYNTGRSTLSDEQYDDKVEREWNGERR